MKILAMTVCTVDTYPEQNLGRNIKQAMEAEVLAAAESLTHFVSV